MKSTFISHLLFMSKFWIRIKFRVGCKAQQTRSRWQTWNAWNRMWPWFLKGFKGKWSLLLLFSEMTVIIPVFVRFHLTAVSRDNPEWVYISSGWYAIFSETYFLFSFVFLDFSVLLLSSFLLILFIFNNQFQRLKICGYPGTTA